MALSSQHDVNFTCFIKQQHVESNSNAGHIKHVTHRAIKDCLKLSFKVQSSSCRKMKHLWPRELSYVLHNSSGVCHSSHFNALVINMFDYFCFLLPPWYFYLSTHTTMHNGDKKYTEQCYSRLIRRGKSTVLLITLRQRRY